MRKAVMSDKIPTPVGPYSMAVQVNGALYLSGQVGQDPATGKLVEGDVTAQAEQTFRNLASVLAAAGKSFADVTRVGVYLTSMGDFPAVNAVYARHFEKPYPARSTVAVAALPLGATVEIDLIAH
jgi:2-iminobutanoate/2-iminopropanoate deaminase